MKLGFVSEILDGWTFEESRDKVLDSLRLSKKYMEQFVI